MLNARSLRSKGFTLVEIMIVVAIIGILLAIAVPGFLKARQISRENASGENMVKIDGAVQQYILEWSLPGIDDFITLHTTTVGDWDDSNLIGPNGYLRSLPQCPAGGTYFIIDYEANEDAAPVISLDGTDHIVDFPGYVDGAAE